MYTEAFLKAYNESRNGTDNFYRHPMVRNFAYSDGVRECAEASCYWMLDILATELPAQFRKFADVANTCEIVVTVANSKAVIAAMFEDGVVGWSKKISYTDMPEGVWKFFIADEDGSYRMILFTEY